MSAPPSPREPGWLQKLRYLRDPLGYIADCQRRLGDIFTLQLVKPTVVVCSPELAKAVYTADDDVLVAGEAKRAIFGKLLGDSSTLLLDGADHVRRRRLMLPRFRGEVMHTFGSAMVDACTRAFDAMPRNSVFALHPVMHGVAFDVILQALFSATPRARSGNLRDAMYAFATTAVTSRLLLFPALQRDLGPLSPWHRVMRAVTDARAAIVREIDQRRRDGCDGADLTGLLMSARDDDGSPFSELEIRDEILTMVAAGHETTSMALTWLCHSVFTRDDVYDRLVDELARHPRTTTADLDALPYLDAVVRESLRHNSLIPNGSGRLVKRPFRLAGHDIQPGFVISVAFHALHHRIEVYACPHQLSPERFLGAKYSPYEAVAFGGGTRRCLGMPFALFEMKLVLATLLEHYRLDVVQDRVRPSWRGMFLTPSEGLRVRVRARRATPAARV